jgi:hypothetical protein
VDSESAGAPAMTSSTPARWTAAAAEHPLHHISKYMSGQLDEQLSQTFSEISATLLPPMSVPSELLAAQIGP